MPSVPPSFFLNFLLYQFSTLPVPTTSYHGKTVIVTGANSGVGLETARHFVRLGAAKVILACRNTEKGEVARADILTTTTATGTTVDPKVAEVWPLDLCSIESVRGFCRRAEETLDRLDVVVANAAVFLHEFTVAPDAGGYETTIATNVVSTFLLAVLLLPPLRRTAARFNVRPSLSIVASEAHLFADFKERTAPSVLEAFQTDNGCMKDRYHTSKLLVILLGRELARRESSVLVNMVNPGFCRSTNLFASFPTMQAVGLIIGLYLLGRSAEMGSRAVLWAVDARDTHGEYVESCRKSTVSRYVSSPEGKEMQGRLWGELMGFFEGGGYLLSPGLAA